MNWRTKSDYAVHVSYMMSSKIRNGVSTKMNCLVSVLLMISVLQPASCGPADPRALISNMFQSKLSGLYDLRDALQASSEETTASTIPSTSEAYMKQFPQDSNSDAIYQSLSELFNKDDELPADALSSSSNENINKKLPRPSAYQYNEESMLEQLPQFQSDALVPDVLDGIHDASQTDYFGNSIATNISYVGPEGEEVPQEYWIRVKGIVGNMKSILEQMYPPQTLAEKRTFSIFDKAISFGDNINVLNKISKTFDEELLGFLGQKWTNIKDTVVNGSPVLKFILSMNTRYMTRNFMMSLIKQLGHLLHQQAFTHLSEMDFVTELMRSSGFKDIEIQQVFQLLDLPTDIIENEISEAEGRQLGGYNGYNIEKSGGYGHSGGGGYGGGGGYMQSFDPFVLLAGLAFATFLAYLLYRLLSSTTGRKRDIPDISLALDLSDIPTVVENIYSWIEKTEEKYGDKYNGEFIEDVLDESEGFGYAANTLWSSFQADRLSHACVKRYLCDYASKASKTMMGHGTVLEQLALTSLAQLFGEEESAKMMDTVQSDYLSGKSATCSAKANECDDVTYESVVTTAAPSANGSSTSSSSSSSSSSSTTMHSATEWTATISPDTLANTETI